MQLYEDEAPIEVRQEVIYPVIGEDPEQAAAGCHQDHQQQRGGNPAWHGHQLPALRIAESAWNTKQVSTQEKGAYLLDGQDCNDDLPNKSR